MSRAAATSVGDSPAKGHTWTIPTTEARVAGRSHPSCQRATGSLRMTLHEVGKWLCFLVKTSAGHLGLENNFFCHSRIDHVHHQLQLSLWPPLPRTGITQTTVTTTLACWMSEHLWMLQNPQWLLVQAADTLCTMATLPNYSLSWGAAGCWQQQDSGEKVDSKYLQI